MHNYNQHPIIHTRSKRKPQTIGVVKDQARVFPREAPVGGNWPNGYIPDNGRTRACPPTLKMLTWLYKSLFTRSAAQMTCILNCPLSRIPGFKSHWKRLAATELEWFGFSLLNAKEKGKKKVSYLSLFCFKLSVLLHSQTVSP